MISPAFVTVIAVLMVSASQHAAHCEEIVASELSLLFSQESVGGMKFCRLQINGMDSVLVNGLDSENFGISAGVAVEFDYKTNLVTITGRQNLAAMRYQYVVEDSQFHQFIIGSITNEDRSGDMGFALLYYDGSTVLFSNSASFPSLYRQIEAVCPKPPQQCNITTRRANDELVLQIPCFPRSLSQANDDILELTGSESNEIKAGETLAYFSNSLRYQRGSTTLRTFEHIDYFYFLEDASVQGLTGRRLTKSVRMSSKVFAGPGVLRVGRSARMTVAFFSRSQSANEEVNAAVVDEQLTFDAESIDNIVNIIDVFTTTNPPDNPLIQLHGMAPNSYRVHSFPTADKIEYNSGAVTITNSIGQSLASYSNFGSLSIFWKSEIQTFSASIMSSALQLPSGSLTLYTSTNGETMGKNGHTSLKTKEEDNHTSKSTKGEDKHTNGNVMGEGNEGFAFAGVESPIIQRRINNALDQIEVSFNKSINSTTKTFLQPDIFVTPDLLSLSSENGIVTALFGQNVTVYESADVDLRCQIRRTVPQPTIIFLKEGSKSDENGESLHVTWVSETESILTISKTNFSYGETYECRVINNAGFASVFTDLQVMEGEPPIIVNNYNPIVSGGPVVTARDEVYTREILVCDPHPSGIPIDDEALLNTDINVVCGADGLPRPFIKWSAQNAGDSMAVPINESRVTVPRAGRSIYNVDVVGGTSIIYQCTAGTEDEETGLVQVTAISYTCEFPGDFDCSEICGVGELDTGNQSSVPRNCFRRNGAMAPVPIPFTEVPLGLFAETSEICDLCPEITYEYVSEPGECSKTCNRGFLVNNITCLRLVDGMRDGAVDDLFCDEFGVARPPTTEECNIDQCPRWVIESDFSPCSSTCAGGTHSRTVTCYQMQRVQSITNKTPRVPITENSMSGQNNVIVNDLVCPPHMPRRMEACNSDIPCPNRWLPLPWGPCEADNCQTRVFNCTSYDPSDPDKVWTVEPELCVDPQLSPSIRSCGGAECNRGEWRSTSVGACSLTCGTGTRHIFSACFVNDQQVSNSDLAFCDGASKPPEFEYCSVFECPGYCDSEPDYCGTYKIFRLCENSPMGVKECCKSCPLQAAPITLPITLHEDDIMLSIERQPMILPTGEIEVCCTAQSISNSERNATLSRPLACLVEAEYGNIQTVSKNVPIIPDTKDNTGCTRFPPASPSEVIEFFVVQLNDIEVTSFNVTYPSTTKPNTTNSNET